MILLEESEYYKLIEPLREVSINNLFARSVVEHKVTGKVFVDDPGNPQTYHVVHPCGMSLLFGEWNNKEFNGRFRDYSLNIGRNRDKQEWMQSFPDKWDNVLKGLYHDCLIKSENNKDRIGTGLVELNTRINFKFNFRRYFTNMYKNLNPNISIIKTDSWVFQEMKGNVMPSCFWDNEEDFLKNGVGYSLFYNDELAATAFSSYVHDNMLELGIETTEKYRRKSFAENVCKALIDHCLIHSFEPIWSCRVENIGSYKLALKLGFEPTARIPYYRLSL